MSETSEEKKKRKLIAELRDHQWLYQYSLFPRLEGQKREEDKSKAETTILLGLGDFRDRLRRKTPNIGILFELRKLNVARLRSFRTQYRNKTFIQIYITFRTTKEIDEQLLKEIVEDTYSDRVNILERSIDEEDIVNSINTIRNERLYDFTPYYQIIGNKFNRYSCIHRSSFIKKEEVL
nr:hypothetical protein [Acinetobacter oleivorans]